MTFGKSAWENANNSAQGILQLLRNDIWSETRIGSFVKFWSELLFITINGMTERINTVYNEVLSNQNPTIEQIEKSLKTKSNRWKNGEVQKIAPIVIEYCVRGDDQPPNQNDHHQRVQDHLGKIGPVYTTWCHYLIEPTSFPPLDRFNYTSYCFIRAPADDVKLKVPQNFSYAPFSEQNDYHKFKSWFIDCVTSYRG
jgi:hypothetical protein